MVVPNEAIILNKNLTNWSKTIVSNKAILKAYHDSMQKTLKLVFDNSKGKDRETLLESLDASMAEYCTVENDHKVAMDVLEDVRASLTGEGDDIPDDAEMSWRTTQGFYEFIAERKSDFDVNSAPKSKEFKKKIADMLESAEDGEVLVTTEHIVTIDPIGQQRMQDPVRSKVCGHNYERSTILGIMDKKKETRCPYATCRYPRKIRPDDLEDNPKFKEYLANTVDD